MMLNDETEMVPSSFRVKVTNLCLGLTSDIQLLQPERHCTSKLSSKKPRQAMASWLKNFLKFSKSLSDSYIGLVHLHTTKKITHVFNLHKKPKK